MEEPMICPRCKSNTIECDDTERIDANTYIERWYCKVCNCEWDCTFDLTFKTYTVYDEED